MPDTSFMQQCLDLAQLAKGHSNPNPMVGAVLVHEGRVLAEGYHHFYGASHAEVNCLESVPDEDKHLIAESTMYVSLEPCAHFGLTPPCVTRLISAKVKKVVIANIDPFDKVSGRGIAILQEAGIEVQTGVLENEGLWVNRRFFCFHTQKRPYIILKWAQTADGFIGPEDKSRLQITGEESIQLLHKWRSEEAAIMVGYITALKDNPRLSARHHSGRQPLRIALDCNLTLPLTHNLFNDEAATWIVNDQRETMAGNVRYINVPFDNLITNLLARLYEAKILSVIIEGGGQLLSGFIESGIWDEARVFTGPQSIGTGVKAPVLHNEQMAFTTLHGSDSMTFYTNKDSEYPYVPGMEL
jgi:diaminohydroxyphosphoribosylaminopyrimidine deaminase / 5-amino-6-(5-phosphoribosylamino)uracil reductase